MIQKTLKTTQGKLLFAIPTALSEITLGKMMQLQEKESLTGLEALSILADIPLTRLQNVLSIDDLQVFTEPVLALANQIKNHYNSNEIPKAITFIIGAKPKMIAVMRKNKQALTGACF